MTVRNLIAKMVDNYQKIRIDVCENLVSIKETYYIKPHETIFSNIPDEIWHKEIEMMALYIDGLSVVVSE